MNIPFLNLGETNSPIESEIIEAIKRVIKSGRYILGNECRTFEQNMANALTGDGRGFVVGCNSGTDALILSLKAGGITSGDEVITVSHTAIPTVSAIVAVGAVPVFVDVDADTWVMDVGKVKAAVTAKTRAIIPVHLYGNMVDVIGLRKLLDDLGREDIIIIEDCAQAQGSELFGRQAGTFGDFGAFSFYPSKNIGALGDGGAVFTRNEDSYRKLTMYRNYGQKDRYHAEVVGGINSRLDEIQAAILTVKLKYLADWKKFKLQLMSDYREAFDDLPINFQAVTANCVPIWHLCVIALEDDFNRDDIQERLRDSGLQTLIHYPHPTHLQPAFKNYCNTTLPTTERLAKKILSLPFSHTLDKETFAQIVKVVRAVLESS